MKRALPRCVAQLWVNQTDFDNLDGAVELLTVSVAGKEASYKAIKTRFCLHRFEKTHC